MTEMLPGLSTRLPMLPVKVGPAPRATTWSYRVAISTIGRLCSAVRDRKAFLKRAKGVLVRFGDSFTDANAVLAECARRGLEGIVCRQRELDLSVRQGLGPDKGQMRGMESRKQRPKEFFEKV
jgi:hypothetical protein